MLVFPYPLSGWRMFRVPATLTWPLGAAWIIILILLWILYRSPRNLQFWQLWFYLFLLPVLQIIPLPIWAAYRYLYIPAIGAFVLFSKLFFYVSDHLRWPLTSFCWEIALAAVLVAFGWQT